MGLHGYYTAILPPVPTSVGRGVQDGGMATRSPLLPLPFQGVGELNIGRTAVRPYGIPSPA